MAISGAAISPGMGKMSRGLLGSLLALVNVRLGVWLPSPKALEEHHSGQHLNPAWKPWWGWYLREVLGVFRPTGRFLYVSDGGHWENLGLVELFRRGCTEIYCISAAGDGTESFSTIAEALALARELFWVEVAVCLTALRPGTVGEGRHLRRRRKGAKPSDPREDVAWCPAPYVVATFTYPPRNGRPEVQGSLLLLEANLAKDVPWDVQAWAEANPAFPDDPTTDQLFDHRQFESYLALGRYQMRAGLDADAWAARGRAVSDHPAGRPVEGDVTYRSSRLRSTVIRTDATSIVFHGTTTRTRRSGSPGRG
jgi:hypothetical protein